MAPYVSLTEQKGLSLDLPPLDQQRAIGGIFHALDGKIENNRRLTKTLEEIASALFKARFIDFLGCDDLVESGIGPIPQGWSSTLIGDLARYVNGKAFTKFGNGQGRMVIRIAELRSGPGKSTIYSDHETEPDFMAAPRNILFAWSGSLDVYRWHRPEALINQHIFKVIPKGFPDWFVFHALKYVMPHFQAIAADKATTMGHIKRADLHAFSVATPPAPALREHDAVFAPLFERAFAASREAETLAQVRDQLLPRLISGQILIPSEEQLAAEIA
jgi:type I restriction enzyme, S subunit